MDKTKNDLYKALKNLVTRIEKGLSLGEKLDLDPARIALAEYEVGGK